MIDVDVLEGGDRDAVAVAAVGVVEHGRRQALESNLLSGPGQRRGGVRSARSGTCARRPECTRSAIAVRPTALTTWARASGASSCRFSAALSVPPVRVGPGHAP